MAVRRIKGSWWVDFRHGFARYRKRSPLNSKGGAAQYEATLRGRLARGEPIDGVQPTAPTPNFAKFATNWFETYVVTNNKPSEIYAKKLILARHLIPWFGKKPLDQLDVADLEAYKADRSRSGLCAKTINNHLAVLGRCLGSAVEWRIIGSRPTTKLLRVAPQAFDTLSALERAALLRDRVEPMWNAMLRLAICTGLRPGELAALRWDDINFRCRMITVRASRWRGHVGCTKTNRVRHVPLTPEAVSSLTALPHLGDLVFCNASGKSLSDSARKKALARMCRRAGVRRVTWYAFRHSFASGLSAEGTSVMSIKELLGHSSIATTLRYIHVTADAYREALDALARLECPPADERFGQPVGNPTHEASLPAPQFAASAA